MLFVESCGVFREGNPFFKKGTSRGIRYSESSMSTVWPYVFTQMKPVVAAAKRLYQHYERCRERPCDCSFRIVTGMPCVHVVLDRLVESGTLSPSDFDPHWQILNNTASQIPLTAQQLPLIPPRVIHRPKPANKAHRAGSGVNGTQRIQLTAENFNHGQPLHMPTPPVESQYSLKQNRMLALQLSQMPQSTLV